MIKIGDRVSPTMNMPKKGTVINVTFKESKAWFIGGSSSQIRILIVEHDDGDKISYTSNDLTPIFE
jgi:hypothetical protein|tara:strand:+ start:27514 stop:27711 length:198 start_codon:yes stop_codon:yes gene_type:complete